MQLRNALLIFSFIILGFCFTLYFQTEDDLEFVNYDQYKSLQYNQGRSHSLEELNAKLTPYKLEDVISEIHERNKLAGERTRVMELGAGNGRVLMTLKKMFPDVEFYGINKEKTHTFYRRESFILTAFKFEIFDKTEVENIQLPFIVFQNLDYGARIPYDENRFDVVYSQSTMSQIKYKFELFNEVMRVLKKGGRSFHTDVRGLRIFARGNPLNLKDSMRELRKKGVYIQTLENPESVHFTKPGFNLLFPVSPHQPIPQNKDKLTQDQKRPEMDYSLNYDL